MVWCTTWKYICTCMYKIQFWTTYYSLLKVRQNFRVKVLDILLLQHFTERCKHYVTVAVLHICKPEIWCKPTWQNGSRLWRQENSLHAEAGNISSTKNKCCHLSAYKIEGCYSHNGNVRNGWLCVGCYLSDIAVVNSK